MEEKKSVALNSHLGICCIDYLYLIHWWVIYSRAESGEGGHRINAR